MRSLQRFRDSGQQLTTNNARRHNRFSAAQPAMPARMFRFSKTWLRFGLLTGCALGIMPAAYAQQVAPQTQTTPAVMMESQSLEAPTATDASNAVQIKQAIVVSAPTAFYSIEVPSSSPLVGSKEAPITDALLTQATQLLLLKLTGRPSFVKSPAGENFIAEHRKWLKSYLWVPVTEDGVKVAENLQLNFDADSIKERLTALGMKVWPLELRGGLLVMGSVIQDGILQKLTYAQTQLNPHLSLIERAHSLGLKSSVPVTSEGWVYPVNVDQSLENIQNWLMATNLEYLLVYKLVAQGEQQHELSWRVFSNSGAEIVKGRAYGSDQQALLEKVLPSAMARMVDLNDEKLQQQAQLRINLLALKDSETLLSAKEQLKQDIPVITHLHLSEVEGSLAQFEIDFQGNYADLLGWLQRHPQFQVQHESEILRQIDVTYIMPLEPSVEGVESAQQTGLNAEENSPESIENDQLQENRQAPIEPTSQDVQEKI